MKIYTVAIGLLLYALVILKVSCHDVETSVYFLKNRHTDYLGDFKAIDPEDLVLHAMGFRTGLMSHGVPMKNIFDRPSVTVVLEVSGSRPFVVEKLVGPNTEVVQVPPTGALFDQQGSQFHRLNEMFTKQFPESVVDFVEYEQLKTSGCEGDGGDAEVNLLSRHFQALKAAHDQKLVDNHPDLLYIRLDSSDVEEGQVQGFMKELESFYADKLLLQVVSKRQALPLHQQSRPRQLIAQDEENSTSVLEITEEEQIEFILLIWTNIFFLFLLFFIFCCIDWQSDPDPLLYTTFKESSK